MSSSATPAKTAREPEELGRFFAKKAYVQAPLPRFAETRSALPSPIYDEEKRWIDTYWKAWEIAFRNFHEPAPLSGLVSRFIDAAFNKNIFLWDSCFMTMFCNVAHPLVPGISTLDNFYARQHEDGEISREIRRADGVDFPPWQNVEDEPLSSRWGWNLKWPIPMMGKARPVEYRGRKAPTLNPRLTLDGLNHPVLAWAELEHHRWSGDRERIEAVWEPLVRYYAALRTYLRQGNGLYVTDWASMDNSTRNPYLAGGGTGVDISAEMVLFARQLQEMGLLLGKERDSRGYQAEAQELSRLINELMWSRERGFYFDLTVEGKPAPVKTVAAYWTLLSGVASEEQARLLVAELKNPETFGRLNPVPTCAADEKGYEPHGGYWRGATWAPTLTMVIRGLERYGQGELAREYALRHIRLVADVYAQTGTIWENYAPDYAEAGKHVGGLPVVRDFVGWSGVGPILYLLEYAIGLKARAPENRLEWEIRSSRRCGCERFRFAGHVASLVAEEAAAGARRIGVSSDGAFRLDLQWEGRRKSVQVAKGESSFAL